MSFADSTIRSSSPAVVEEMFAQRVAEVMAVVVVTVEAEVTARAAG